MCVCFFVCLFLNSTLNVSQVFVGDAFQISFLGFDCVEGIDII